jgi:hypothetical protein
MFRILVAILLLSVVTLSFSPVRLAFANEANSDVLLLGKWKITHRPVNAAGKPCPFLPETIEFFKDQSLIMSNVPGMHLPYKTDLTTDEMQALEKRSEGFKGKRLLLVKPTPRMDWRSTPMVYIFSVTRDGLSLTVQGWETATFKRVK